MYVNNQNGLTMSVSFRNTCKCKLLKDFRATSDVNILNEYIETKHNFQKLCDKKHKVDKKI